MVRWMASLATLLLAVALSACGKNPPTPNIDPGIGRATVGSGVGRASDQPFIAPAGCPRDKPIDGVRDPLPEPAPGVPADFATAAVVRCVDQVRDVPGQGKWTFRVVERADTAAAELVAELRRPSDPRTTTGICTSEAVLVPYFLLVDATGRAIAPTFPTDGCGKPRRESMDKLPALPFHTISETRQNQVQSQPSVDSGCPDSWKDLFTIEVKDAKPAAARPVFSGAVGSLRVCRYDRITGDQLPVGNLAGTSQVDGDAAKNLLAALDKAGPAANCSAPHARFAVLMPPDHGGYAMVELDGCHRLIRADNTVGQLDEPTVTLLG
jgi:hypothetical protein